MTGRQVSPFLYKRRKGKKLFLPAETLALRLHFAGFAAMGFLLPTSFPPPAACSLPGAGHLCRGTRLVLLLIFYKNMKFLVGLCRFISRVLLLPVVDYCLFAVSIVPMFMCRQTGNLWFILIQKGREKKGWGNTLRQKGDSLGSFYSFSSKKMAIPNEDSTFVPREPAKPLHNA